MKVRAAIFDIYKTVLEVLPPRPDQEPRWDQLWRQFFSAAPPFTLNDFSAACDRIIQREHTAARARGIIKPEVYWPAITCEAAPALKDLGTAKLDEFLHAQAGLWHTVRLMDGAAVTLSYLVKNCMALGIASNAQPYTLHELGEHLARAGLAISLFTPHLIFWSFMHGYSKPNPHVFRILSARLASLDIAPAEILMVGDRLDNDIEPARAFGWQTWHLGAKADGADGSWHDLRQRLAMAD